MTLGEKIRAQRKRLGLSQEKVAELAGVSRQAVTKWDRGQSFPGTENLFKLAEIFGTTVDVLLEEEGGAPTAPEASHPSAPCRPVQQGGLSEAKKRVGAALAVAGAYLVLNLAGRIAGAAQSDIPLSLAGLLWGRSVGQFTYLTGWLIRQNLFLFSAAVSAAAALLGRYRLAAVTASGFALGLLAGELLGPDPAGQAYGHGHDGWLIWGGIFLLSMAMGGVLEHLAQRGRPLSPRHILFWSAAALAGAAMILLLARLGTPAPWGS